MTEYKYFDRMECHYAICDLIKNKSVDGKLIINYLSARSQTDKIDFMISNIYDEEGWFNEFICGFNDKNKMNRYYDLLQLFLQHGLDPQYVFGWISLGFYKYWNKTILYSILNLLFEYGLDIHSNIIFRLHNNPNCEFDGSDIYYENGYELVQWEYSETIMLTQLISKNPSQLKDHMITVFNEFIVKHITDLYPKCSDAVSTILQYTDTEQYFTCGYI